MQPGIGIGIGIGIGFGFAFLKFFTLGGGNPPREKTSRKTKPMPMPMPGSIYFLDAPGKFASIFQTCCIYFLDAAWPSCRCRIYLNFQPG